jgi:hypothetical protein
MATSRLRPAPRLDFYADTADRLLAAHRPPIRLDPLAPGVRPRSLPDVPAALAWFVVGGEGGDGWEG